MVMLWKEHLEYVVQFAVSGTNFFSMQAHAAIDSAGVLDNILDRNHTAAAAWQMVITEHAVLLLCILLPMHNVDVAATGRSKEQLSFLAWYGGDYGRSVGYRTV